MTWDCAYEVSRRQKTGLIDLDNVFDASLSRNVVQMHPTSSAQENGSREENSHSKCNKLTKKNLVHRPTQTPSR